MTNGSAASFRSAAISILGYFGTTNALEFLEDEALGGAAQGIRGFGAIVGFNDQFFDLTERILADKRGSIYRQRATVYTTFESLLCSDVYRGRSITPAIRERANESLKRHAVTDTRNRVLIDLILTKNGPEAQSYRHSHTRRRLTEIALADANSSDYERRYFDGVLEQMARETAATNSFSNKKTKHDHKTTPNLDHKEEQSANGEEVPATNGKAQYWRIILSLLAALLFIVACARHKRE